MQQIEAVQTAVVDDGNFTDVAGGQFNIFIFTIGDNEGLILCSWSAGNHRQHRF